jgi:hypothetical protein
MSLNKHDLDAYLQAKRQRAQKIDFLIVVLFLLIGIFLTIDRPPQGSGTPAFYRAQNKAPADPRPERPVIARVTN